MILFETDVLGRKDFWAVMGIVPIAAFGLYALALAQGCLLSLRQRAPAFDMNLIHESSVPSVSKTRLATPGIATRAGMAVPGHRFAGANSVLGGSGSVQRLAIRHRP